jgi:hypothetical protein
MAYPPDEPNEKMGQVRRLGGPRSIGSLASTGMAGLGPGMATGTRLSDDLAHLNLAVDQLQATFEVLAERLRPVVVGHPQARDVADGVGAPKEIRSDVARLVHSAVERLVALQRSVAELVDGLEV